MFVLAIYRSSYFIGIVRSEKSKQVASYSYNIYKRKGVVYEQH